jgi:integrase/recombinase XerC
MYIDDFVKYLSLEKRFSLHTVQAYKNDLLEFENFIFQNFQVKLVDSNHVLIRSWVVSLMENGISPRSVRRKISVLSGFYKYLIIRNVLSISPVDKVPLPKVPKKLPVFVEESNMDFLFDSSLFTEDEIGVRDKAVVLLIYHTGIRLSELISIRMFGLDLLKNTVKVLGKRNKERILPFSNELNETLKLYLSYRKIYESEYLFVTPKGEKMYPKLVYRIVNNYLSQVSSLNKTSPHVLRHTFATHLLNNGADLNSIKELLGHANLSATQIYTHNSLEKIKSIYKQAHPRA